MSNKHPTEGTIKFITQSALALWKYEILGQLSDGMWENSRPNRHYCFWHDLVPSVGDENVTTVSFGRPMKKSYSLGRLIPHVGQRMINVGRLAKVVGGTPVANLCLHAEHMPETLEAFDNLVTSDSSAMNDWEKLVQKYMKDVPREVAVQYYDTVYTKKDLKIDLAIIEQAQREITYVQ
jgi:hypothetical protein